MLNPISELIIFIGDCGIGKSSLMVHFADTYIKEQGEQRCELSEQIIRGFNAKRKTPLSFPSGPPMYSTIKLFLTDLYGHDVKVIEIKNKDIGISNEKEKYKALFPAPFVLLDEAYDGLCSKDNLPKGQRALFNQRRHNRMIILMATTRPVLINKDIRNTGARIIEIREQIHEKDAFGRICKTTWHCREFTDKSAIEEYISTDGKSGTFEETTYEHDGNIYELYDSFEYQDDFMPKEGEDYET